MKKLFILATAAVALASCSDSDLVGNIASSQQTEQPQAVEFGTYMAGTATRTVEDKAYTGGAIGNSDALNRGVTNLTKARFGVFAYYTGATDYAPATPTTTPNFMYNQELMWSTSAPANMWIYSPVKYWPNGIDTENAAGAPSNSAKEASAGKLSFFAFAPYTAATGAYDTDETYPSTIAKADLQKTGNTTTGVTAITDNEWTGNVWVKYLMPNAAENSAVDLLWGLRGSASYSETDASTSGGTVGNSYNINLTKQIVGERVSFLFKHALAKVGGATTETETETLTGTPKQCGFKVVADVDKNNGDDQTSYFPSNFKPEETLITIKEVKIQDGKSASDDAQVTTVTGKISKLNSFGWFNIETGKWSDKAGTYGPGTAGATYNIQALNTNTVLTDDIYSLNEAFREAASYSKSDGSGAKKLKNATGKEWSTSYPTGVTTTAQKLFANENVPGLLIIPGGTDNVLYVTVDYLVRTADPNLSTGFTQVEQRITNEVSLGTLDPNKYYTIIMHLGLTSVKFEAVVTDWTLTSDATFNEDGSVTEGTSNNEEKVWLPSNVVAYTATVDAAWNVGTYNYATAGFGLGDVVSGTTAEKITAVAKNSSTSTTADITLSNNETTETVSSTTTITCETGKVTLTINQAPAPITAVVDNNSISASEAVTLTVKNAGPSTPTNITAGDYTVGVFTDADCTIAADAANYTDSTDSDNKVTFNTAGTYYIKVTSGESTVVTVAITVS